MTEEGRRSSALEERPGTPEVVTQTWGEEGERGIGGPEPNNACKKGVCEETEPDGTRAKGAGFYLSKDEMQRSGSSRHMHTHAHGGTGSVSKIATHMAALLHHSHESKKGEGL